MKLGLRIIIYLIVLATGILIKVYGINPNNKFEDYFSIALIILALLNILIYLLRKGEIK